MLQVGTMVRVKENAYEGSDDPKDFEVRGKAGEIVFDLDDDSWEVKIGNDSYILNSDELEEVEFIEEITPDTPQNREFAAMIRRGLELHGWDRFEEILVEALALKLVKKEGGKRFYERGDKQLKISIGEFQDEQ